MWQFTQKHNKVILIVVCVVLLPFVGFSFYPIMSRITRGSGEHSVVGTFEVPAGNVIGITRTEFEGTWKRIRPVAQLFRNPRNPSPIFKMDNEDDLWAHIMQVREAEQLGIRIGDQQIDEFITNAIRRRGGLNTVDQYRNWVRTSLRLTPMEFESALREILLRVELDALYASCDEVSMESLLEQYQRENREVTVRVARFGVDEARKALKAIDFPLKPKLEEFYKDASKRYLLTAKEELMIPRLFEEVKVIYGHYSKFDPEKPQVKELLKDFEPAPQEVQQEYERWKGSLYKEEPKKDEPKKDEPKKDEAKKDEAKKDEAKKDEAKKDEAKKDEAKKDEPPQTPPTPQFKPLDAVRGDVVKRLKLKKVLELVHAEAEKLLEDARAKAAAEAKKEKEKSAKAGESRKDDAKASDEKKSDETKDDPKKASGKKDEAREDEAKRDVLDLDLQSLAARYDLEYQTIPNKTSEQLKTVPPFDKAAPEMFSLQVTGLAVGELGAVDSTSETLVYFGFLVKDRPEELKPLEEIEDAVREVAMDEAARERSRALADEFYEALRGKVKDRLKPVLEKEIYAPLDEQMAEEIAKTDEERQKEGKSALSEEERKAIQQRYDNLKKERETPRLVQAEREQLGDVFDEVAKERKVELKDYTFFQPNRGRRGSRYDYGRESRETEQNPILGFLKYRSGVETLTEAGAVKPANSDYGKATYVIKLVKAEPAKWDRIDPRTYRNLVQEAARREFMNRVSGMDRLGPMQFETRYRLQTEVRYRPEEEQGEGATPAR